MEILKRLESVDGSEKYLIELEDKNTIETLYMYNCTLKLTFNSTICVSSQVGCKIGCVFCATGKQRYIRDLNEKEIEGQVNICNVHRKSSGIIPIDAVVFAGMGEPLHNYENVKKAIHGICRNSGINHFEIATAGVVPGIYKMIKDFKNEDIDIRLNLSLHATTDELRKRLIPLTAEYGIDAVMKAAVDYAEAFGKKARIRYMLFKGLNDTDEDIKRIFDLLKNKPLKLIISQYNENNISGLNTPEQIDIIDFYNKIKNNVECKLFNNFGIDIKGGCGQLRQADGQFDS